jgi:hypothetical protein
LTGGVFGDLPEEMKLTDIDDPVVAPKRGRYQLGMVNRASLVHPPRLKSGSLLTANSRRQGKALVG